MNKLKIHSIIRLKRRTIALMVTPEATLVIRAPLWTPRWHIDRFLHQERAWIAKKMKQIQSRPRPVKHEFLPGEQFLYLGQTYRLRYAHVPAVRLDELLTVPASKRAQAKEELTTWYQAQAARLIQSRARFFAVKMGVVPAAVKLSRAETRWGSCGRANALNINWRLIMAPPAILDYVLVHELAHIPHKHHGRPFWDEVARMLPDFRHARTWLRANGHLLRI